MMLYPLRLRHSMALLCGMAVLPSLMLAAETAPVAAASTTPKPVETAVPAGEPLLFTYFNGNGDGLHLAWSTDGLHWSALKNDQPFILPTIGGKLMRDPCIWHGPDGLYHLVWTTGWNDHGFGYAESKDLINWSEQKNVPVMEGEPTALNTWAPEIFYDEVDKEYLIFWATTIPGKFPETDGQDKNGSNPGYNHRIYFVRTKDFKTFSKTELFFNPGFNAIDATIVKDGARYVMVFKDETNAPFPPQKNLKLAFADHAAGPYGKITAPITGQEWAEGPTAIKIGDQWCVYFDKYRNGRYGLITSPDLEHWTDQTDKLSVPKGIRHGTVFRVPAETLTALQKEQ